MNIDEALAASPVMAVVVIKDAAQAVPLARALVQGGVRSIEVTLRTPAALEAMRRIAGEVPEAVLGAGTVLTRRDLEASAEAGAKFAVSPGSTPELMEAAQGGPIPYLPAVATASELMAGLERGYSRFKFFPAEAAGGLPVVKAMHGPFPQVRFCPTGGVTRATAARYLAAPNVACVGGTWLTPEALVSAGDWAAIEAEARATIEGLRSQAEVAA